MVKDYSKIPSSAFTLGACTFELGDNGEGAKSAPIKLQARSGQPIEHPYWGNVVHDMEGMRLAKSRLPVDYCHYDHEVIGYLNKFDTDTGDLIVGGALVPFKDSDRATEIIYKSKNGIPYEASINFGGDGIKIQLVEEGEQTEVNGYTLSGPATVIREWPLRGVAICPYGADANTETAVFNNKNKTFTVEVIEPEAVKEETTQMSDNSVEVTPTETPETVEDKELTQEKTPVVEEPVEVETAEAEVEEVVEAVEEVETELSAMSRTEFAQIKDEFGAEIAADAFANGGSYQTALKAAYDKTVAELATANEKIKELSTGEGGEAVKVTTAKVKESLFKTTK